MVLQKGQQLWRSIERKAVDGMDALLFRQRGRYLSITSRAAPDRHHRLPQLTLAMAVATAEALAEYSALSVRLKWPNDVQIYEKSCWHLM